MKEKLLAAIKTKYSKLGLPAKVLEGFANKLAKTCTEEEKIDEAVSSIEDDLAIFQSLTDQHRTEIASLKKQKEEKGDDTDKNKDKGKPENQDQPDDVPSWAKTLIESNNELNKKLAAIEGKNRDENIRTKLAEKFKEEKVPDYVWKHAKLPESEEGIDEMVKSISEDYHSDVQEKNNDGFNQMGKPKTGQGKIDTKKATEDELTEVADSFKV